jgi:hypothetical protein
MSEMISTEDVRKGSEFGGVGGLVQPPPHDPSNDASEGNMLLMEQDRLDIVEAIEAKKL